MWINYFLAFAYIITLIRIIIFALHSGSFEEKLGKAKNWIIGLIIFTISWFVLTNIFGLNESMSIKNTTNSTKVKDDAFGTKNENEDTNEGGVPINVE